MQRTENPDARKSSVVVALKVPILPLESNQN